MSAESSNSRVLSTAQSQRKVLETAALICHDRSASQGGARVFLGGDWDSESVAWLKAQVSALPQCELVQVLSGNVAALSLDAAFLTGADFVSANLSQVTSRLKPEGVLVLEFAANVPGHSTSEWKQRLASAGYLAIAARGDRATGTIEREIIKATRGKEPVAAPARPAVAATQNLPRLRQIVASILGELLQIPPGELDHTAAFTEFGMDSIGAVAFAKGLNRELGIELKPTILFDYGSIGKLAAFLATQVDLAPAAPAPAPHAAPPPAIQAVVPTQPVSPVAPAPAAPAVATTDIAVIGMSGRFPEAETTEEFWRNLASGRNSITEVPEERWHHSRFYNPQATAKNQTKFKWGGFLTHADKFDPLFFNISGREAEVTDPQQRVFLEECYHALEDGGYAGAALGSALKCGVFAGVEPGDYLSLVMGHEGRENPALFQGNADSILAARISYFLDLKGPSIAVNTACSSSLVAIHLACRSLITKDCDLALSGGVRVYASEKGYLALGNMGMLSAEGQCKTFDAGADGFVPGEAVGVVLLKRLGDAVRDGDQILGVIKGSAINQDGKTNGITAPSSLSQTDVQVEVYEKAGISPRSIQYVEAHGTGTKLGDPIEIEALTRSFRRFTPDKQFCAIASLKTNIGHTMAAAGVCSLIKVLLALKHQKIPPSLNHKLANPYIDFPTSPFSVSTALSEWRTEPGQPRRACINSFGFSGTNCHVLVEEAPPLAPSRIGLKPVYLVALSGKTPEALRARIRDLREWLQQSTANLGDVSFTLNTGRAHFEHRIAFVASSPDELRRALDQVPEVTAASSQTRKPKGGGELTEAALYRQVLETLQKELATISDAGVYREKLSALAALYGKGHELDWGLLHQGEEPRRISLPGYPFARESYWSKATTAPAAVVPGPLHPLVQRDSSTAGEILFTSDLNPDAFYLADHRIQGERVLPGVAYLEMASVAISRLLGTPAIQLNNVVWLRPLRTSGAVAVKIRLIKEGHSFRFEIVSGSPEIMHAQGSGQLGHSNAPARVDLTTIKARCQSRHDATLIYSECAKAGLQLGLGFQTIREIQSSETEVLARLRLADGLLTEAGSFTLHPGLMDGALQATAVLAGRDWGGLPVPHSVGEVTVGKLPPACFAHVVALSLEPNLRKFQVTLLSESGEVLVQLKDFAMRPLRAALPESNLVVLKPVWRATEVTQSAKPVQGKLLLLDGPESLAGQIRKLAPGLEVIEGQSAAGDFEQFVAATGADYIIQWANSNIATESTIEAGIIPVFQLARALVRRGGNKRVSWLFVHPPQADPAWAAIHGLARSLVHEKPNVILRTLEAAAPTAAQLVSELGSGARVEEARLGTEGRFVKSLEVLAEPARSGSRLRTQGVYFITGGLGGLGLILSRYLARQYQARLVITGRSKLDDAKRAALREIEQAGGQILYVAADVSSRAEMQEALRQARERFGVIHGVIHAAGVLQDGFLLQKEPASIRNVLSPKIDGTRILDELTRQDSLDFFLLFSSLSAVLGNVGQTDYGYANAFLDEFARWRENEKTQGRRSGRTVAINWPFWQSGGMRENEAVVAAKLGEAGLALLPTAAGLQLLETSLLGSEAQVIALYGNEQKIHSLVSPPESRSEIPAPRSTPAKAGDSRERILPYLTAAFAELVKIPAARIKAAEPLEKYGIDSIMVMEFTQRLEKDFGSLSKTLLFEHQTLDELAGFFLENHGSRLGELFPVEPVTPVATQVVTPPAPAPVKETVSSRETPVAPAPVSPPVPAAAPLALEAGDIAIIGVFGRFPMADDLEQFWANLRTGRDCIQEIPRERWDYRIFYDPEPGKLGKTRNKWGGFLNGVDRFDAQFFAVTPREAVALDPQERIFLESVWRTVEDAGYRRQDLSGRKVGVYVGVMYGEYQLYGAGNVEEGRVYPISSFYSSIANRVSYFFNWHGPSLAVDTMCSSSLTAMHLACESLRRGESEMAIAGGVNTTLHPHKDMLLSPGGFAASDGRCRSFGEGGDGYIHGEGVGAVLLKPLARAQADGDHIYAVIKASSINHGGKTNGYTVPNPKAQAELIREALRQGNIDPQTVTYVEAHGTGTPLGDPIEISALAKAFQDIGGKDNLAPRYCAVGSVKSNIGHLESAAGIAAVAKVLLQMKHGQIAPSLHSSKLNPNIPFAGSPFRVPQTLEEWPGLTQADQTLPRRAGISSFGAGGANAHLILEEYITSPAAPRDTAPVLMVLSAKSPDRLKARAAQLRDFLMAEPSISLADVAFTLQTGREPMEERLAFVAGDTDQAIACLSRFLNQENAAGIFSGKVRHEVDATPWLGAEEKAGILESLIRQRKWESLAQFWVGGGEVDWQLLHAPESARRIPLPSYPFAGERYWAPDQIRAATKALPVSKPVDDGPSLEAVTYRPIWQAAPLPVIPAAGFKGKLLLFDAQSTLEMELKSRFPELEVKRVPAWNSKLDYSALLESGTPHFIVHHLDASIADLDTALEHGIHSVFPLARALLSRPLAGEVRWLWVQSGGSQPAFDALAGFAKSLNQEQPRIRFHQVLADQVNADLLPELFNPEGAQEVRRLGGRREVRGLETLSLEPAGALPLERNGVYLITGGLGGLGKMFAGHLASVYQARLVLVGRSELSATQREMLAGWEASGAKALYVRGDVGSRDDMRRVVSEARQSFGPITGVLHTAGVLRDSFLLKKQGESFAEVLRPKVQGTIALDDACANEPLQFFALFSSTAGLLGNAGQSDYAYANAFMDAFARQREAKRLQGSARGRTVSINWPLWQEGGMRIGGKSAETFLNQLGLYPLPTDAGLNLFANALRGNEAQVMPLWGVKEKILHTFRPAPVAQPVAVAAPVTLNGSSQSVLAGKIEDYLKGVLCGITQLPVEKFDSLQRFEEMGIDSIIVGEFNTKLASEIGALPKTLLFEFPNLREVARNLAASQAQLFLQRFGSTVAEVPTTNAPLEQSAPVVSPSIQAEPTVSSPEHGEIAIIGVAGRYPAARNLDEFWENLKAGKDCITEVPKDRWDADKFFDADPTKASEGKIYCRHGAFIDDVDKFDPLFFGIAPVEADLMDPQERLFLETAWHLLEDAGHTRADLASWRRGEFSANVGVFVGVTTNTYNSVARDNGGERHLPTTLPWSLANRVSYLFNFNGPSLPVDTACSSSLSAIHLACQAIQNGECQQAIAGGVNLYLHPAKYVSLCMMRMLSPEGKCRSFGEGGSGFGPGEGVGAVLLKPLKLAIQDGDRIYAVIKGTAINHGGRTNGYTVPNPQAHAELIKQAVRNARIDSGSVSYIEAHGTGTSLGDPIEIDGLTRAFQGETPRSSPCAIGSVKSNIGHLEAAAGIAGLTKILLQMKHGQIAPSLHAEKLNPNIDFDRTPLRVQRRLGPWLAGATPRRAGISSFGAGGTNAHVIVEEYPFTPAKSRAAAPVLFVLSAKNATQLKVAARTLERFITSGTDGEIDLASVACTLQVGREALEERVAFVIAHRRELLARLRQIAEGAPNDGVLAGRVKREIDPGAEALRFEPARWDQAAAAWIHGRTIDWRSLWGGELPRRISLPGYPFARNRHWIPVLPAVGGPGAQPRLHPLLHRNDSTFERQAYGSQFDGEDLALNDHQISGESVLPGAATLEMAFAAVRLASGQETVRLQNVVWLRPLRATDRKLESALNLHQEPDGAFRFEITTPADGTHVQGKAILGQPFANERVDLAVLRSRCQQSLNPAELYQGFESRGMKYGPAFQVIRELQFGPGEALTRLEVPAAWEGQTLSLHPSLVDGTLQSLAVLGAGDGGLEVPFAVGEVECSTALPRVCYGYARATGGQGTTRYYEIKLLNESGEVLARLNQLSVRRYAREEGELLFLQPVWESASLSPLPASISGTVLLFDGAEALVALPESPGLRMFHVQPGERYEVTGSTIRIRANQTDDYERLLSETKPDYVVYGWARLDAPAAQTLEHGLHNVHRLAQAVLKQRSAPPLSFLFVHRHGEAASEAVAGYGKSWAQESTRLTWKSIGVEVRITLSVQELSASGVEVRYGAKGREVRNLAEPSGVLPNVPVKDGGVYLITGGAGGLGRIFAEELSRKYRAKLLLVGRSELSEDKLAWVSKIGATYMRADVSTQEGAQAVGHLARAMFGRVDWVLHAAGETRDALIANKSLADMEQVIAAKVGGALALDEALKDEKLEGMVFFSSTAGLLGNAGQSDYAYANAWLDAFARERELLRQQGRRHGRTLSLNWPLWEAGGMKSNAQTKQAHAERLGIAALPTVLGLSAFERMLKTEGVQCAVFHGNATMIKQALGLTPVATPAQPVALVQSAVPPVSANGKGHQESLMADLKRLVAKVLRLDVEVLEADVDMSEYGFDSITLTTLSNEVNSTFGFEITPATLFEYTTLQSFTDYLARSQAARLQARYGAPVAVAAPKPIAPPVPVPPIVAPPVVQPAPLPRVMDSTATREPVAIVGMSGMFPGSPDLEAFWKNLEAGADLIGKAPTERWDFASMGNGPLPSLNMATPWGGFLADVDKFDPLFFDISPREAALMDPQQRVFLQTVWKAIEDSGHKAADFAGTKTGLFVGVAANDYASLLAFGGVEVEAYSSTGNAHSVLANRVSYFFDLRGPSEAIDTACSSSLVAIHRAIESLQCGSSEMAIVGGVNVLLSPGAFLSFNKAGMLCEDGRCKTFDESANGYVRGEGVGALVLKPLSRAQQDGDHIYGVITGSAENHGGHVQSLTVPNPNAQAQLIQEACARAGIDPHTISYIEAHGTGTPLGDPIEINGLKKAFGENRSGIAKPRCAIASVKTNIGHLETAAGIAGIIKVLLALKHRCIPGNVHLRNINPYIQVEGTPFYFPHSAEPWEAPVDQSGNPVPRRAGVSSFGFGGSNAHILIEEFAASTPQPFAGSGQSQLIVLSARNPEQLKELAGGLLGYLERENGCSLADLAFTLQAGRTDMDERLAFVAADMAEVRARLSGYLKGQSGAADVETGNAGNQKAALALLRQVHEDDDYLRPLLTARNLRKLARLWVAGVEIPWEQAWGGLAPRRLSLPTYPFARDSYWVPKGTKPNVTQTGAQRLHPLLHRNESTLQEQVYATDLGAEEIVLAHHQVAGTRILPGAASLEMAFAGLVLAAGTPEVEIRDITWLRPLVGGDLPLQMALAIHPGPEGALQFEIRNAAGVVHVNGGASVGAPFVAEQIDSQAIKARCPQIVAPAELYARLRADGLEYGPGFQAIKAVQHSADEAWSELEIPAIWAPGYRLHPALVDAAWQSVSLISSVRGEKHLPFAVERVECAGELPSRCFAYAKRTASEGGTNRYDLKLADEAGNVLARIYGYTLRPLEKASTEITYYTPVWESRPLADRVEATTGTLLWFGRSGSESIAAPAGMKLVRVLPGNAYASTGDTVVIRADQAEDYERLFTEVKTNAVVHVWAAGELSVDDAARMGINSLHLATRALLKRGGQEPIRLVFVHPPGAPLFEGVGGYLKSAGFEQPLLQWRTIATEPNEVDWSRELPAAGGAEIRYLRGDRQVRSLAETKPSGNHPGVSRGDVCIITGGAGGLGRIFAEHLVQEHEAKLILAGRSELAPERRAWVERLGAKYIQADLGEKAGAEKVVEFARQSFGRVDWVLHAAGELRDGLIWNKPVADLAAVVRSKVHSARFLDEALGASPLKGFVLFSSVAGLFGNAGQADYAYANAGLDALAESRQALRTAGKRQGLTVSINWPLWKSGGMKGAKTGRSANDGGSAPLEAADGLRIFENALRSGWTQVCAFVGSPAVITPREVSAVVTPILTPQVSSSPGTADDLMPYLIREFAALTKVPLVQIKPEEALEKYGFDSIMALEFSGKLEQRYGPLSKTLLFEHQTLGSLAGYLAQRAPMGVPAKSAPAVPASVTRPLATARFAPSIKAESKTDDIAIIGLSGRYPQAETLDDFWANLAAGKDCVQEIPAERWDNQLYYEPGAPKPGKSTNRFGGFIKDFDKFDALFFNISPREAEVMDPQERLFLETVWNTVEDAGYSKSSLDGQDIGVFVGVMYGQYQLFGPEESLRRGEITTLSSSYASIANRVSYYFNWHGPSGAVDSMCSSSLVSIHLACESLKRGESRLAIAGGVNVILHPHKDVGLSQAGFLNPEGKSRSFGKSGARGYVPGEGVGAVLLKPLAQAIQDGDHIYGVIKASAVNHSGKTNGYAVPNPQAQAELVSRALKNAGITADSISYVEAAATGSSLGDAMEIGALTKAFQAGGGANRPCAIGSVKSNIGHLESASGMAGLTKVLLQMQHQQLVPSIHAEELSDTIAWNETPFQVQRAVADWASPATNGRSGPRRAGINAFGAGGTNAHLIVEEFHAGPRPPAENRPCVLILSARDRERLTERASQFLKYLRIVGGREVLSDIAYTLQVGRETMAERIAFLAANTAEVISTLEQFLDGKQVPVDMWSGNSLKQTGPVAFNYQDLAGLAEAWVRGGQVDWTKLHTGARRHRLALPGYPFARERHWFRDAAPVSDSTVPESKGRAVEAPVSRLPGANPPEQVKQILGKLLKLPVDRLDESRPMTDYGLDSMTAITFLDQLEQVLGIRLAPSDLIEHPTLQALGARIARKYPLLPAALVTTNGNGHHPKTNGRNGTNGQNHGVELGESRSSSTLNEKKTPRTLALAPMDYAFVGAGRLPMQVLYYFEHKLEFAALRSALNHLGRIFYPLNSRLVKRGFRKLAMREGRDEPDFLELTCESGVRPPAQDQPATLEPFEVEFRPEDPEQKLAKFRLFQLEHGSVLSVNVSHVIADGFSFYYLLSAWAALARGEDVPMPELRRTVFNRLMAKFRHEPLRIPVVPPTGTGHGGAGLATRFESLLIDPVALLAEARAGAAPGLRDKLTENSVITAYVWKRYAEALSSDTSELRLSCPIDFRRHCPSLAATYFGNAVYPAQTVCARAEVLGLSLPELAAKIYDTIRAADEPAFLRYQADLDKLRRRGGVAAVARAALMTPQGGLVVTNVSRFPHAPLDFGSGTFAREISPVNYAGTAIIVSAPGGKLKVRLSYGETARSQPANGSHAVIQSN